MRCLHKRRRSGAPLPSIHARRRAELDAILAELEGAGLVEQYVNEAGEPAMRLTAKGEQAANQAALSSEDDAAALMAALLEQ
jgi:DNA-binding MarR family transcriptional regulator